MPNPKPQDGAIVGSVGQVVPIATLYLADYVSGDPQLAPGTSLGSAEPGATWVRMGLLRDDNFDVTETDPTALEYRRGFKRRYFGEVIRQAGVRTIAAQMDEVENAVLSLLTGDAVHETASPAEGNWMDVGTSEQYDKSLLLVYFEALSGQEFHLYNPHALVRFKYAKQDVFQEFDLTMKLIPFLNASNKYKDLRRYEFNLT